MSWTIGAIAAGVGMTRPWYLREAWSWEEPQKKRIAGPLTRILNRMPAELRSKVAKNTDVVALLVGLGATVEETLEHEQRIIRAIQAQHGQGPDAGAVGDSAPGAGRRNGRNPGNPKEAGVQFPTTSHGVFDR